MPSFNIPNVYENLDDALNNKDVVFDIAVPADQLLSMVKVPLNSYALLQKRGVECSRGRKILETCKERQITAALKNFPTTF